MVNRLNVPVNLELVATTDRILLIVEEHLQPRDWLECDRLTIADLACFPYIGLAVDAKVELEPYHHVVDWIERIKQLPGYISMSV